MPLFSVIIPSYNRCNILPVAVKSVLAQTLPDFELLIVDDGSTDETRDWVQAQSDQRIKYIYQQNAGVCAARNKGAQMATGSYIVFLDSDDEVTTTWLEDFNKLFNEQEADWVCCSLCFVEADKNKTKPILASNPYNDGVSIGLPIPGSWAVKKSLFINAGGFDEQVKYGENVELGMRMEKLCAKKVFTDKVNLTYYSNEAGGSKNLQNKINSNLYILQKHAAYYAQHPRIKHLLLQNAGVASARLGIYRQARKLLYSAWLVKPGDIKTFFRLLISAIPPVAARVWK